MESPGKCHQAHQRGPGKCYITTKFKRSGASRTVHWTVCHTYRVPYGAVESSEVERGQDVLSFLDPRQFETLRRRNHGDKAIIGKSLVDVSKLPALRYMGWSDRKRTRDCVAVASYVSVACSLTLSLPLASLFLPLCPSRVFAAFSSSMSITCSLSLSLALTIHRQAHRRPQCIRPVISACSFSSSSGDCTAVASSLTRLHHLTVHCQAHRRLQCIRPV
jgi:hypothetical protein